MLFLALFLRSAFLLDAGVPCKTRRLFYDELCISVTFAYEFGNHAEDWRVELDASGTAGKVFFLDREDKMVCLIGSFFEKKTLWMTRMVTRMRKTKTRSTTRITKKTKRIRSKIRSTIRRRIRKELRRHK